MRDKQTPQRRSKKIIAGFFISIFILGISSSFAQSLGDVARQERERNEDSRRPHVYTNEDLARPQIVVRDSGETVVDAESASEVPSEPPSVEIPSRALNIVWPDTVPLGDVARFYRRQRELELAKELQFAVQEPPALDLDSLLPNPLATPLPDIWKELPPPPPVAEPLWDHSAEPKIPENTVRVVRGDTLWKIAGRHLGNGKAWTQIAAANPELKDPNRILPGQTLRLPATAAGISSSSSSEKLVRVQAGDSLWKLAASQLGSGNAWGCLAAANRQIENVNRIYPGQMLVIPANCSAGI